MSKIQISLIVHLFFVIRMPYTVAVVNEVLRFADLLSLSIFHSSHRDTTFEGFHIPKVDLFKKLFYLVKKQ